MEPPCRTSSGAGQACLGLPGPCCDNFLYQELKWHAFGVPGRPALTVFRARAQGLPGRALDRREIPPWRLGSAGSPAASERRPRPAALAWGRTARAAAAARFPRTHR
jgi:hypothetical protein